MANQSNQPGSLTVVPNGMGVELCYTQSTEWVNGEMEFGPRAHKFSLAISPIEVWSGITQPATTGAFLKEVLAALTAQDVNIEALTPASDPNGNQIEQMTRPAQYADIDLESHMNDIYNDSIVAAGAFDQYDLAIRVVAYDDTGEKLAETTMMQASHSPDAEKLEPHALSWHERPTRPEMLEVSPGDNKITLRFTTITANYGNSPATIAPDAQVKILVQLTNKANHAEAIISEYTVQAKDVAAIPGRNGLFSVTCDLEGRIVEGDETSDHKVVNGEIYQIFASVIDTKHRWSYMSSGNLVTPRNLPAQLTNAKVTTVFTPSTTHNEGVLLLSDVTFNTNSACLLSAEISDLDVVNPAHIYWGVVGDVPYDVSYAYGFRGINSSDELRAKKSWDGERIPGTNMYKVTMNIPKSWFLNEQGNEQAGYKTHIKLQARVGQTTKHDADDSEEELYGPLMSSAKTAYLVTSEQVVFNQTVGPLNNGIQVIERNSFDGRQRFSVEGKTFSPTAAPNVTYSYPQKDSASPLTGSISTDPSGTSGDFVGYSDWYGLSYKKILNGTGYTDGSGNNWPIGGVLTFRATINDPNDLHSSGVNKFATESEVPLYPFRNPGGELRADIQRTTVNTPPLCTCDYTEVAADLQGWSLDSMQMEVRRSFPYDMDYLETNFSALEGIYPEDNGVGFIEALVLHEEWRNNPPRVVYYPDLSLNSLNGIFTQNQDLSYNNWPGNYDCKYEANFSLPNMAPASKTLYTNFMEVGAYWAWGRAPTAREQRLGNGKSNYYNDPVITSAELEKNSDGHFGMRIQGSTNGSTLWPTGYQSYGFVQEKDGDNNVLPGQYGVSWATATEEVDVSTNWIFNTFIAHTESLVENPDTDGFKVTVSGEIFDGFAMLDPIDAQSYTKLSFGGPV